MMNSKSFLKFIMFFVVLYGCASVQEMAEKTFEKPKLSFESTKVKSLSFEDITLLFNVKVDNPNIFGLNLAGLTYDLKLNDNMFLQGEEDKEITIPAEGSDVIQLPLTLNYANIYNTINSLKDKDKTSYGVNLEVGFNVPVIGFRSFPVSHSGEFPLPKLPSVKVASISIEKLTVSGADLNLRLKINNPNSFGFAVNKMDYSLIVDGQEWVSGLSEVTTELSAKDESVLSFPISLKFLEVGRSAFKLLNSGEDLNYNLKGGFKIDPAIPLLDEINVPFDQVGKVPLSK